MTDYLSCLTVLLLLPYFTPAAIRWRTRCREERRAFSAAVKSGVDLTTLEAREYPLKKVALGIYLVLALGILGFSGLVELKVFCVLKDRGSSCHVVNYGRGVPDSSVEPWNSGGRGGIMTQRWGIFDTVGGEL